MKDLLNLSVSEWIDMLKNPNVFNQESVEMVLFVFSQNFQSSATEIGKAMGNVSQQKVSSINISTSRKIYKKFGIAPQKNRDGSQRYWDVIFEDLNNMRNPSGYYVLKLRYNLIKAIQIIQDTEPKIFAYEIKNEPLNRNNDVPVFIEGNSLLKHIKTYGRSALARKKCLDFYGYICQICEFDFQKEYGDEFSELIVVHHIEPLGEVQETHFIDPQVDLIPVCANCHMAIHSKIPAYHPNDIKKIKLGLK